MPTLWSRTLIPTLRAAPSEAEVPSHQLMLRAGLVSKLGAGSYTYLPLGQRVLTRIMAIIREEMCAAGAAEIFMPTLQPLSLWESTGRRDDYGDNLFVVKDRHGREQALGPTHEEVVTDLVGASIQSYKDLPKVVYQIQTKFRDEFRPRFGVLRSREFLMKDAYSFHLNLEGGEGSGSLNETYDAMYAAYQRIFDRCGVPYRIVEADSGPIGGGASHEFMVPSPTGEDLILSNGSGYAANVEKCEIGPRPSDLLAEPTGELEPVETPGVTTIADLTAYFRKELGSKLAAKSVLKTLVFGVAAEGGASPVHWALAVVRGDHEVNPAKLKAAAERVLGPVAELELAEDAAARGAGFAIGFVGPHAAAAQAEACLVFVDPDAAQGQFWVAGGNAAGTHVKHFNWKRELAEADRGRLDAHGERLVHVADIRNAAEGDPAPEGRGGGTLSASRGIEVGHIFKLGRKYTEALGVTVLGDANAAVTPIMGCYGIGVNRILASAIEVIDGDRRGHDENGIIWPAAIAPYDVLITALGHEPESEIETVSAQIAKSLESKGYTVLIDDRDERPGVKFKDADLIGIPLRLTIGAKGLKNGEIEVKTRDGSGPSGSGESIPLEKAVAVAVARLTRK